MAIMCSKCRTAPSITNGTLAFTKPNRELAGLIAEDASGEYCEPCAKELHEQYVICYRPESISRAEARRG